MIIRSLDEITNTERDIKGAKGTRRSKRLVLEDDKVGFSLQTVPDPSAFRSGREFAAWLGLTPRQNSSGGKPRLGGITKQGDRYLRHLLVLGARTVVRYPKPRSRVDGPWIEALLERRRPMVVAVAVANKLARTIWAMLSTGEVFRSAQK